MSLFVVLALVAGACGEDHTATTAGVGSTLRVVTSIAAETSPTEAVTSTSVPMLEPFEGILTIGTDSVVSVNGWELRENAGGWGNWGGQRYMTRLAVVPAMGRHLFDFSLPEYGRRPVLAATAPPPLVREGDRWTATIAMREGLLWSDGTPVTAGDYVFTIGVIEEFGLSGGWEWEHPIKDPDDPDTPENEEVRWMESVEALDDHTIKITLASTDQRPGLAIYPHKVMFETGPMPEHYWGPAVEACREEDDPKGCLFAADALEAPTAGPFTVGSWEPGGGATLVANPNYYYRGVTYTTYENGVFTQTGGAHNLDEAFYGEPEGRILSQWTDGPYLEAIKLVDYEEGGWWEAFLRGDVDITGPLAMAGPPEAQQRVDEIPDVQEIRNPSEGFRYLAFNLRKPPMSDLAFRRALAYVLDKQAIIDGVVGSTAFPIYSIIPPQLPFWYTGDIETWGRGMSQPERVEAATAVLADAGYTWVTPPRAVTDANGEFSGEIIPGEGLTQPDDTPMPTISLLTPIAPQDMLRPVQGEWITRFAAPLGITIDWQPVDFDTIASLVFPPTADGTGWDMYTLGWGGGNPSLPCSAHRTFFDADQDAAAGAGVNTPGYDDPDFEALSDAFDAATTEAEAQPICAAMERNIARNLPYIVLWTIPVTETWRSYLELPFTQILGGTGMAPGLLAAVKLND